MNAGENELNIDDIKREDLLLVVAWIMNKMKVNEEGAKDINLSQQPP